MKGERKSIYLTEGTGSILQLLCHKVVVRNEDGQLVGPSASRLIQQLIRQKFVKEFPELATQIEAQAKEGGEAMAKLSWEMTESGPMPDDHLAAHIESALVSVTNRLVNEELERWKAALGCPPVESDDE